MLLSKASVRISVGCANYVDQDIGRMDNGIMVDDSTYFKGVACIFAVLRLVTPH